MTERVGIRGVVRWLFVMALLALTGVGCLDRPVAAPETKLQSGVRLPVANNAIDSVDILFAIDNSNSMRDNQTQLAAQFSVLISQLVNPPNDPATMRPRYPPVKSMHVGVVSSDLGTPGSTVPSCFNSDLGDDGLLNPVRQGQAIRGHQPWTTAQPGNRPARCTMDPNQYPTFLTFTANMTDAAAFTEDFVCNAFLSVAGCGLEQQLESAYRALVVHNPRAAAGNTDPNAGFLRADAALGILMLTDEEDSSVRDCRFAESGTPCTDGVTVFDSTSSEWASSDLNLRDYLYVPGSAQDPTWNLNRYIDPSNRNRGFLALKPGHPELVAFAAITGVPINLPRRSTGAVDYNTLLGTSPSGSDGYVAMSPEGPVSMRQRNMDPACSSRVVPACRQEGSGYDPSHPACDTNAQYFAWPARRVAEVARRFDAVNGRAALHSICRTSYSEALIDIADRALAPAAHCP